MHSNDVEGPGAGEDLFFDAGFDVISVKARSNRWYQDLSLADVAAVLAPLHYDEVLTYGTSMGGYAAAYFAAVIRPRRAVLFSPQSSIDPRFSEWDERWKEHWSLPFEHAPIDGATGSETQYVILYDPWTLDGRHAKAIAAAVGEENVRHVRVPFSGHETIGLLRDAGVLSKLVLALMRDSPEAAAHLGGLRRQRKQTWSHAFHLFFRAQSQGRRIVTRNMAMEILRRAERPEHRILSIAPFIAVSAWVDTANLMNALGEIRMGEQVPIDGAVASVDLNLRLIEDPRIRAWLLPLWGRMTGREAAFAAEAPPPPPLSIFPVTDSGLLPLVSDEPAGGLAGAAERLGRLIGWGSRRGA